MVSEPRFSPPAVHFWPPPSLCQSSPLLMSLLLCLLTKLVQFRLKRIKPSRVAQDVQFVVCDIVVQPCALDWGWYRLHPQRARSTSTWQLQALRRHREGMYAGLLWWVYFSAIWILLIFIAYQLILSRVQFCICSADLTQAHLCAMSFIKSWLKRALASLMKGRRLGMLWWKKLPLRMIILSNGFFKLYLLAWGSCSVHHALILVLILLFESDLVHELEFIERISKMRTKCALGVSFATWSMNYSSLSVFDSNDNLPLCFKITSRW